MALFLLLLKKKDMFNKNTIGSVYCCSCMYVFYIGLLIERYFEFQEQEVKLGQLEYNLVKLVIE